MSNIAFNGLACAFGLLLRTVVTLTLIYIQGEDPVLSGWYSFCAEIFIAGVCLFFALFVLNVIRSFVGYVCFSVGYLVSATLIAIVA